MGIGSQPHSAAAAAGHFPEVCLPLLLMSASSLELLIPGSDFPVSVSPVLFWDMPHLTKAQQASAVHKQVEESCLLANPVGSGQGIQIFVLGLRTPEYQDFVPMHLLL